MKISRARIEPALPWQTLAGLKGDGIYTPNRKYEIASTERVDPRRPRVKWDCDSGTAKFGLQNHGGKIIGAGSRWGLQFV